MEQIQWGRGGNRAQKTKEGGNELNNELNFEGLRPNLVDFLGG